MNALQECHSQLARLLGSAAEPIEVLQRAEEHRAYWRPERVRVLLLAESHVYTTPSEMERSIVLNDRMEIPRGFVRLVYCMGYGENRLLNRPIVAPRNSGTPQYWKIFYSCVNRVFSNEDFVPILSRTPFPQRIRNKLALLQRLKEIGVWLVDASLAALYPKPAPSIVEACLQTSWDSYVVQVIRSARPSRIVCIGRGVARSLGDRLSGLNVPVTVVPQPNARLASTEHFGLFQQYHDIVWSSSQEQAEAPVERAIVSRRVPVVLPAWRVNVPRSEERLGETRPLCETVAETPRGARVRRWTLREDNQAHFHGVVHLTESPLYLELSWRRNVVGQVKCVGLFRLDLHGLLKRGYIRHDPVDSDGSELRLRTVRAADGLFYIQARHDGPRLRLSMIN
jgi:hypothetical protein